MNSPNKSNETNKRIYLVPVPSDRRTKEKTETNKRCNHINQNPFTIVSGMPRNGGIVWNRSCIALTLAGGTP